jgi:hypothetical protein
MVSVFRMRSHSLIDWGAGVETNINGLGEKLLSIHPRPLVVFTEGKRGANGHFTSIPSPCGDGPLDLYMRESPSATQRAPACQPGSDLTNLSGLCATIEMTLAALT